MKKQHWLVSQDADRMVRHLRLQGYSRKLHLVYLGSCRRIWKLLPHEESRKGIEVAERFVDGLATNEELETQDWKTEGAADCISFGRTPELVGEWARHVDNLTQAEWAEILAPGTKSSEYSSHQWLVRAAYFADTATCLPILSRVRHPPIRLWEDDRLFVTPDILRDVFGRPWHRQVIETDWLTWRDSTAAKLAQTAYDDRRFDLLPILADALHEAGCCNDLILSHLRGPGPHVRGCWAVDLVLGKS